MIRAIIVFMQEVNYSNELDLTDEEIKTLNDLMIRDMKLKREGNEILFDKIIKKPKEEDRNAVIELFEVQKP